MGSKEEQTAVSVSEYQEAVTVCVGSSQLHAQKCGVEECQLTFLHDAVSQELVPAQDVHKKHNALELPL